MLISKIYETFKFFKRFEDGSIDKDSVKFEINDRLYRAININELKELILTDSWRMNNDNTGYSYAKKYPYYKSLYRVSESKILTRYIKRDNRIIVEFDKNELSKINNIKIKPISYWSSPKFKKLYELCSKYKFNLKEIRKDKLNIIPKEYVDSCANLIFYLKRRLFDTTRTKDTNEFEERIISKVENIKLPSNKAKLIKRIWIPRKYAKIFPKNIKNKIKQFGIKLYKLSYNNNELNLDAHNQLYTPENNIDLYQNKVQNNNKKTKTKKKVKKKSNRVIIYNFILKAYTLFKKYKAIISNGKNYIFANMDSIIEIIKELDNTINEINEFNKNHKVEASERLKEYNSLNIKIQSANLELKKWKQNYPNLLVLKEIVV